METENEQQVTRALDDVGDALRRRPSVRNEVMRRITQRVATTPVRQGRRLIGKLVAVAACVVVALLIWNPWGNGGGIGASEAFAAAIANVERAHTFACRQIVTQSGDDGELEVREMSFMFKEPNLERLECGDGLPTPEVMITDYDKQVRLIVLPDDKTAELQDVRTMYTTDEKTGQLKAAELGTHARDDVLRISAQAVKDLGRSKLNGRDVWVLQSADGAEPVKTVYVNPADGKPVQVEMTWPSQKGQSFVYADIRIDAELDDSLFSLEPPAGYAMQGGGNKEPVRPVDDVNGKMMAKMKALAMECIIYASKRDFQQWPETLDDLRAGGMDAQKLTTLVSAPESKDGKPVIVYRKPRKGATEGIILYEVAEIRRDGQVVAGFMDGHVELMSRKYFEEQLKE